MKNIDAANHTRGRSEYIDDIPVRDGCLFAVAFPSPVARGGVRRLDVEAAREADGVVCVLTAEDVPGDNQIGNILPDEQLFATGEVHYCGQPMAIVVAASEKQARAARSLIEVDIDEVPPILDPRDAASRGEFIVPPRTFVLGDTSSQWGVCAHICVHCAGACACTYINFLPLMHIGLPSHQLCTLPRTSLPRLRPLSP